MLPNPSSYNVVYLPSIYPKCSHKVCLGFSIFKPPTHFSNLVISPDRPTRSLSMNKSPVFFLVSTIPLWSIPSKVGHMIVGFIAIIMTCLLALWSRADKCLQHKNLDILSKYLFAIQPKRILNIFIFLVYAWREVSLNISGNFWPILGMIASAFCPERPYISEITDLIANGTRNVFPDFFHFRFLKQKAQCLR